MLKYILIILLVGVSSNIYSQGQGEYLEPTQNIFSLYDYQFEYYFKVRQKLLDGLSDSPEVRFLVIPSFTPEYVVDIEFDREQDKYFIKHNICKKSIWYNDNWEKIMVYKFKSELDETSALKIKELFELAIRQSKYPEDEIIGLDGANYYFFVDSMGIKTATIWSPNEGTNMFELIEIANLLPELAKSNKGIVKLSENELERINQLIENIKNVRRN